MSWTELTFLQCIRQTVDQNGARLQSTADHAVKQLSICRLLLVKEHRFILPSCPNFLHFHMQTIIYDTFSFFSIFVRNVEQTKRNVLRSNQTRSQADLLLRTLLEGNELSNGEGILLNENSFIVFFFITY